MCELKLINRCAGAYRVLRKTICGASRAAAGRWLVTVTITLSPPLFGADTATLVRIGTGGSGGSYLPVGSLIAGSYSQLDSVMAIAQRSNGSVANVQDLGEGLLEAALAQADIVHWAYRGDESFAQSGAIDNLRTLASLYLESVHFVVREGSGIEELKDLSGKRVSTDEIGSGTQINVQHVLRSQGLAELDIKWVYLKPIDAIDRLRRGALDAFFVVAGYPAAGVNELIEEGVGRLLPLGIPVDSELLKNFPFFTVDEIPGDVYGSQQSVTTLAVPAQLIVDARLNEEIVYELTRQLWQPGTLTLLKENHPKGSEVNFSSALIGLSAPLHRGAARFYRERAHPDYTR